MAKNVNFNMAAAAIFDFIGNQFRDLIFGLCVKFGANPFNNGRVIAM